MHGNPFLIASGSPNDPAFPLQRSMRLRSSNSAYLNRTFAAGSQTTWTYSLWVKRGTLGVGQVLLDAVTGNYDTGISFTSSDTLEFYMIIPTAVYHGRATTTAVYRDPSAWYHLTFVMDTTNATANDRMRIYVNGIRQALTTNTTPTQNTTNGVINSAINHTISKYAAGASNYFDGYMAEVNFIDGQALTPSSFGGYNAGTNVWEVRKYSGTYGTNGFYLPFTNNSAVENLGYDLANSSPELITNGMFVANVSGWTVTPGTGGSPSITWQSAHTARIANINAFSSVYYQAIPTVIGQTYYVQSYASNISLGGATRVAQMLKGDNTNFSTNFVVIGNVPQSAGAGTIRGTFVATATTTYIGLQADVGGTSGSADFTAVSVTTGSYKNSWNPFGVSLTAGVTYDSMLDVPTNTGPTNSNYEVFNPLNKATPLSITNGNLQITATTAAYQGTWGTLGVSSGKWYFEATITAQNFASNGVNIGVALDTASNNLSPANAANAWAYNNNNGAGAGRKLNGATSTTYGATYTLNDVIGVAVDLDTGTLEFYKNGISQGVAFSSGVSGTIFPYVSVYGTDAVALNCGQRPFTYTPPSGFKALNTYNLPEPTIPRGDKYFNQYLYTGNGGGLQVGEIQKPASLFNLDRSLRFRSSNSAYLSRTPASAGNQQKFTWSGWVKRSNIGSRGHLFQSSDNGASSGNAFGMYFDSANTINIYNYATGYQLSLITNQLFRDPVIWNHIVLSIDTTQATPSNRALLYINGLQVTSFSTATYPTQNTNLNINENAHALLMGSWVSGASYNFFFDGYLADVYFVDGQALTPTSFGAFDGNNYWTPKAYTGTYGTNGFHLEFKDYSGTTATTIGKDTSGNSNNFTPTGINLTAPANTNYSWDSMVDVPTLTSTDVASFATLNPLTGSNISSGNLQVTTSGAGDNHMSTIPLPNKGKWYAEMCPLTNNVSAINGWFGVSTVTGGSFTGLLSRSNTSAGRGFYSNGVEIVTGSFGALNDVIGVAVDMDALTVTIYINGVAQSNIMPIPSGIEMYFYFGTYTSGSGWVNFGQRPFKYSNYGVDRPAATFKTLNTFNVAEVLGDVESPDLIWVKSRSASTNPLWFNSLSGVGKYAIGGTATGIETADPNSIIQFNKNGFLIGNNANINTLSATYVADAWKAGDTNQNISVGQYSTSPNVPAIISTTRANPISGVSLVNFAFPASGPLTIGHGLGKAPKFMIVKSKDNATNGYVVYHESLGNTSYALLQSTAAPVASITAWNNTSPTNNVFTLGSGFTSANYGTNGLAMLFAEIEGFSKISSYLSNGAADGTFVYTGFRPRFIMIKQDVIRGWIMFDTARNTYNAVDKYLFAESSAGDGTLALIDITSNGFKHRSANVNTNTTAGSKYIYIAFAENPFKYALAR